MSFSETVKRAWNRNRLMSVLLELTYACNLDCAFCYNDLGLEGEPLSLAQYRVLLDELAAMSVLDLTLSGGEPLAHPGFFEIGGYARELGFVIRIKSNGHALKEHTARRIRAEIDPFVIEVSIHGATPEVHDRQTRVPGSFERLIANIEAMKRLGLRLKANSVLTRWNEDQIESLLALGESLGVWLQIDPEVKPRDNGDRGTLELAATTTGLAAYREALAARAAPEEPQTAQARAASRRAHLEGTDKHCGAGSSTLTVDPFGNVLPCVQWRVPAGNLHEQSISAIWRRSKVLDRVRETTGDVRRKLEALGDAGLSANFCPGAAHTHSGDPLAVYPAAQQRMDEAARERVRLPVL